MPLAALRLRIALSREVAMIERFLNALITALLRLVNLVIRALVNVINFIITTIAKLIRIARLSLELLFYLLPFGETIYVGLHQGILWLTAVGSGFIAIFAVAFLRELFRSEGDDVTDSNSREYITRQTIFGLFFLLNLVLGSITLFLYLNIQFSNGTIIWR
jgi:hypothetical protein